MQTWYSKETRRPSPPGAPSPSGIQHLAGPYGAHSAPPATGPAPSCRALYCLRGPQISVLPKARVAPGHPQGSAPTSPAPAPAPSRTEIAAQTRLKRPPATPRQLTPVPRLWVSGPGWCSPGQSVGPLTSTCTTLASWGGCSLPKPCSGPSHSVSYRHHLIHFFTQDGWGPSATLLFSGSPHPRSPDPRAPGSGAHPLATVP